MVCALMDDCPSGQRQYGCECVSVEVIENIKNNETLNITLLLIALIIFVIVSVVAYLMRRKRLAKKSGFWKIISGIAIFLEIVIIFALFFITRKYQLYLDNSNIAFGVVAALVGVIMLVGLALMLSKSNERVRNIAKIVQLVSVPIFLAFCCLV